MLPILLRAIQKLKFAKQHKYHFLMIYSSAMNHLFPELLLQIYDMQEPDNTVHQIKSKLAIEASLPLLQKLLKMY